MCLVLGFSGVWEKSELLFSGDLQTLRYSSGLLLKWLVYRHINSQTFLFRVISLFC